MEQTITWDNTQAVLEQYAQQLVAQYRENLTQGKRNASSKLADTVKAEVKVEDTVISVELTLQDYWYYVEHGRKAGKMPPISKIEKWIKVKNIPLQLETYAEQTKNKLKKKKKPTKAQQRHRLAYLIARKIGREGTKGTHDLQSASNDTYDDFKVLLEKAIAADVGDYVTKIFRGAF